MHCARTGLFREIYRDIKCTALPSKHVRLVCYHVHDGQADLKTTGVPEWINSKVKAEQLTVVKCIKDKILKL